MGIGLASLVVLLGIIVAVAFATASSPSTVNETATQQSAAVDSFGKIVDAIAPSVGGKPITLKLVNPELRELISRRVE